MNAVNFISGWSGVITLNSAPIRIVSCLIVGTLFLGVSRTSVRRDQSASDSHRVSSNTRFSSESNHHRTIICPKETVKKQSVGNDSHPPVLRKSDGEPVDQLPTHTVVLGNNPPQTDHLEDFDAYLTDRQANQPTVASIEDVSRRAEAHWSIQLDSWKKTCNWKEKKTHKLYLSE